MTENKNNKHKKINEERVKYYVQLLDMKRDTNMTRIYSVFCKSDSLPVVSKNNERT